MSLRRCLAEHTHREMRLSNLYDDYQFNEPSRTDYYLMQIAQYEKLGVSKKGARVSLADMKIEKKFGVERPTLEQVTEWSKQRWAMRSGRKK